MTPERFAALADAYGGDLGHWPPDERDAARTLLLRRPELRTMLSAAADLDTALATWTVPGPGAALAARIATAVGHRHAHARRRLWLSSLGAATALASGAAAGALVVALSAPVEQQVTASPYELTVLGAPLDVETPPALDGHP